MDDNLNKPITELSSVKATSNENLPEGDVFMINFPAMVRQMKVTLTRFSFQLDQATADSSKLIGKISCEYYVSMPKDSEGLSFITQAKISTQSKEPEDG